MSNCFEILELTEAASERQVKEAFRALSKKYHPDLNGNTAEANEKFNLINSAHTEALETIRGNFALFGVTPNTNTEELRVAYTQTAVDLQNRAAKGEEKAVAELKYLAHLYNVLQASLVPKTEEEW